MVPAEWRCALRWPGRCWRVALLGADFGVGGVETEGAAGLAGGMLIFLTLSRIIWRMVFKNALRNSAVLVRGVRDNWLFKELIIIEKTDKMRVMHLFDRW